MGPVIVMDTALDTQLDAVRRIALDSLHDTSVAPVLTGCEEMLSGKMLRARLALRMGRAAGMDDALVHRAAAALEMIHGASLLHDDVIDGSVRRRGAESFWVRKGVSGAIIVGDLLVCRAFETIAEADPSGRLTLALVSLAREMCEGEAEQELLDVDSVPEWDTCVRIARRKTGSLFAFAAVVSGGDDDARREALREAGYAIGTAYQLADDIFDACGDAGDSDKSLRRDATEAKTTAATSWRNSDVDPRRYIADLCDRSAAGLSAWPGLAAGWRDYLDLDFYPAVGHFLHAFNPGTKGEA